MPSVDSSSYNKGMPIVTIRNLNQRAAHLTTFAGSRKDSLRIRSQEFEDVNLLDFGVKCEGGLEAGLLLARMCLAGMATVDLAPHDPQLPSVPQVFVRTDHPVAACLMSQYAGWKIATDDYFAMGSGPMRAVSRKEDLFHHLPDTEDGRFAVGVLEAGSMPTAAAVASIRKSLPTECRLTLAVAPTASQAGNIQVVARSVETALHKLHELKFPLDALVSGTGVAPLPPVAKNDLAGIGRTNDSILYGATVNLWVRCDDEQITDIGPKVPSNSSPAHGQTFLSLFKAANHDFYAMDAALFSPAVVVFHNLKTGRSFSWGERVPQLLKESFGM
jgi:methenyltetrahydromethanopterin cyclohydrolase